MESRESESLNRKRNLKMLKALILAFVVFTDGQSMGIRFESVARCEAFAAALAPYVESVECETIADPVGVSR